MLISRWVFYSGVLVQNQNPHPCFVVSSVSWTNNKQVCGWEHDEGGEDPIPRSESGGQKSALIQLMFGFSRKIRIVSANNSGQNQSRSCDQIIYNWQALLLFILLFFTLIRVHRLAQALQSILGHSKPDNGGFWYQTPQQGQTCVWACTDDPIWWGTEQNSWACLQHHRKWHQCWEHRWFNCSHLFRNWY